MAMAVMNTTHQALAPSSPMSSSWTSCTSARRRVYSIPGRLSGLGRRPSSSSSSSLRFVVTRLHRSSVGEPVGLGPSSKENAKEATNNSDNNTPPVEGAPAPHAPIDPFDEDDVVLWTSDDATKRVVYRTAGEIDVYALENLAQAVGWPKRPVDKVEQALKHSFLVAALHLETIDESGAPIEEESELIGLARATSDHVFNATIWDVLVDPKWQGNGFGTALVERTVNTLHRRDIANISLFADAKAITFYERLGFKGDLEGVKGLFFYPTYR